MTIAIILHNLVIDIEGAAKGADFAPVHTQVEEEEDRGPADPPIDHDEQGGEAKRQHLVEELLAFRQM